jgi:hypothetical protein
MTDYKVPNRWVEMGAQRLEYLRDMDRATRLRLSRRILTPVLADLLANVEELREWADTDPREYRGNLTQDVLGTVLAIICGDQP